MNLSQFGATPAVGAPQTNPNSLYNSFISNINNGTTSSSGSTPTQGILQKFGSGKGTPGANSPAVTGTDPRFQGLPSTSMAGNLGGSIGPAIKDTLGNDIVKPAAELGVGAYNIGKTAVDLAAQGGGTVNEGIGTPRNLPFGIGKITPPNPNTPEGFVSTANDTLQTLQNAMIASGIVDKIPELPKMLGDLTDRINNPQLDSGTLQNIASGAKPTVEPTPNETTSQSGSGKNLAQESIKNPANLEQAYQEGRITAKSGKSIVTPSTGEQKMIDALKPLEDAGKLKDPTGIGTNAMNNQLENGATVQKEIEDTGTQIREGIKGSKATWNTNELKGVTNKVDVPDPVKNDATMSKNAASLRKAIVTIGDTASKDGEGTLDVRQNFDKYVKQNYGENFFSKGRNADPLHQYVFSLRDGLSDWSSSKLPNGQLPSGENFRDALQRQHQLINAQSEMAEKYATEFKGSEKDGTFQRWMKNNPEKGRFLRRAGYTVLGISAAGAALRKELGL